MVAILETRTEVGPSVPAKQVRPSISEEGAVPVDDARARGAAPWLDLLDRALPVPGVLDLSHEIFVRSHPAGVRARLEPSVVAAAWGGWPGITLELVQDRGDRGLRWLVTGEVRGRAEVWLEQVVGGTVVHHYVHVRPAPKVSGGRPRVTRALRARADHHVRTWATQLHRIKDDLEGRGG